MRKMRFALMFVALAAINAESYAAMNVVDIRREARFLTDRMGYELRLSNRQFEDVYEINFDFLYQANEVLDDVAYGYDDAIDYYYYLLDVRNEDLVYVLRNNQYRKFVNRDYFFRPIYMVGRSWGMRIWKRYTDYNYFYFSKPVNFNDYDGAHYRIHFSLSYYADRYNHKLYQGAFRLWGGSYQHHQHDGWINVGKKKYAHPSSRPWGNAKNYEKSRLDLKEGFASNPSRDANKRKVMVGSEENSRSIVNSNSPTRVSASARREASSGTNVSSNKDKTAGHVRSNNVENVSSNRTSNVSRSEGSGVGSSSVSSSRSKSNGNVSRSNSVTGQSTKVSSGSRGTSSRNSVSSSRSTQNSTGASRSSATNGSSRSSSSSRSGSR